MTSYFSVEIILLWKWAIEKWDCDIIILSYWLDLWWNQRISEYHLLIFCIFFGKKRDTVIYIIFDHHYRVEIHPLSMMNFIKSKWLSYHDFPKKKYFLCTCQFFSGHRFMIIFLVTIILIRLYSLSSRGRSLKNIIIWLSQDMLYLHVSPPNCIRNVRLLLHLIVSSIHWWSCHELSREIKVYCTTRSIHILFVLSNELRNWSICQG